MFHLSEKDCKKLIFTYSHADTVVSRRVIGGKGTQSHAKILCPFYNEKACHIIALIAVSTDLLTCTII